MTATIAAITIIITTTAATAYRVELFDEDDDDVALEDVEDNAVAGPLLLVVTIGVDVDELLDEGIEVLEDID